MAALIDADEFRERFDIDTDIGDPRITPHIGSASRRLRKWVGDANYDASLALVTTPDANDDDGNALLAELQNAEAHLTFHYALLGWNSPLSGKGVVATAMSDEGKEMRKYLTPRETAELAGQYLQLAEEIAFAAIQTVDSAGLDLVVVTPTSCEAATRLEDGSCLA